MKVLINYVRTSDLPGVGVSTKIRIPQDNMIDIKCHNTGGQIFNQRYDFRAAIGTGQSEESPNGYADLIYRWLKESSELTLWIACVVPDDTQLPTPNYQEFDVDTFPRTLFLAEGVNDGDEPITGTEAWTTALGNLSYAEKQALNVAEVNAMFEKKEDEITNSQRYADLNPDIPKHIAYWWRAATAVIKHFFQDEHTDPLIVAEMAKQAAAGPTTRNDQLTLLRNLNMMIAQYPNGPQQGIIWVETRNLNSPADVRRKTVVQSIADGETYPMAADFDSTDDSWVVANQQGIVTYDNDSPVAGAAIRATLTDYDGGLRGVRYRWQQRQIDGTFMDMMGRSNRQRSWTIGATGNTYRCRVLYDDNYADDQEAIGAEFTV